MKNFFIVKIISLLDGFRPQFFCVSAEDKKEASAMQMPLGTAKGIRTPDLLVRSQTLYPAELSPHVALATTPLV